jgi:hypothetical protein
MILAVLATVQAEEIDPALALSLANNHVLLEFEPKGRGLARMEDLATGVNHISPVEGRHLLWEVAWGVGRQIYTITNNTHPCTRAEVLVHPDGTARAVMEWTDLRWWLEDDVISIVVTVDLPADSGIGTWRISVENRSDYWGLWAVLFPLVNGFPSSGRYDIARPVFAGGGQLLKKWTQRFEARYPGSTWPMQFMALNHGSNAVYFGTRDCEARAKDFVCEPVKGLEGERFPVVFEGRRHRAYLPEPGERLYILHYPENMGVRGSDYPDPYPVDFGVYQGDWVEAALRYRAWALEQEWAAKGPLSKRPDVPDKIKSVGIWIRGDWVWNGAEGPPEEMNRPMIEAQERLGVPLGLHWYRWHRTAFDNLYPHFLPARDKFKERVKDLIQRGVVVMPYINGSSADMNIPDWKDFAPYAVRDEAGGIRLHYYSDKAGRLLSMCGATTAWQDAVTKVVDDIFAGTGVDGIYVDQVSGLYHELCFDPSHGHPLGGGSYWADGNRELMRKIKTLARIEGRECVVTSEGSAEVFFDVLDANLLWSQPSEREIPMMEVVYSGYTLFFGSPCDYTRSDNYFRYAQGRALIDGRQNGWMDFGLFQPEHEAKVDYLRACGRYRVAGRDYLTYGRLWGPLPPLSPLPTFTEEAFGWGMYEDLRAAELTAAEARLWQAEDGRLAVFFANYTDLEVEFPFEIDPAFYGLSPGPFLLREFGPDGALDLGAFTGPVRFTARLSPGGLKAIEIAPGNRRSE